MNLLHLINILYLFILCFQFNYKKNIVVTHTHTHINMYTIKIFYTIQILYKSVPTNKLQHIWPIRSTYVILGGNT